MCKTFPLMSKSVWYSGVIVYITLGYPWAECILPIVGNIWLVNSLATVVVFYCSIINNA